jgi:hypothetical protein
VRLHPLIQAQSVFSNGMAVFSQLFHVHFVGAAQDPETTTTFLRALGQKTVLDQLADGGATELAVLLSPRHRRFQNGSSIAFEASEIVESLGALNEKPNGEHAGNDCDTPLQTRSFGIRCVWCFIGG